MDISRGNPDALPDKMWGFKVERNEYILPVCVYLKNSNKITDTKNVYFSYRIKNGNEDFYKLNEELEKFNILSTHQKYISYFGGISPINYDPGKGLEWGCQFIMMNYQKIDTNMSNYAYIFKDSSFVLKSDMYRNKDLSKCKKYFTGEKLVYENKEQKEINYIYTKT